MHDHAPTAAARRAATALVLPALVCGLACAGCAAQTEPTSVVVLPGLTKTFGQFQADDAACRAEAARAAGQSAAQGAPQGGAPQGGAAQGAPYGAAPAHAGTAAAATAPAGASAAGLPPAGKSPAGMSHGGTPPGGTAAAPGASGTVARTPPPEQIYANCMTARGNMLQAGGPADDLDIGYDSAGYAYYSPGFVGGGYPVFNDYYPWEYGDTLGYDFWGAPLFFGWGGFGGGYFGGRYWGGHYWPGHYFGGHPWGMYHGFRGGMFHGGYHGGYHGGGFHGGGFHGGGGHH